MKKVIASAGVLALGAISVQSVWADLSAGTDKPWSISGTLRGFYDDNYATQPDFARKSSFGFEVRPQATYGYSDGPTTLTTSYTYSDRYYAQRPGNKNDQSHDFEFTLNHNFNERYSAAFQESFVSTQEPEIIDSSLSFPLRANGNNLRNYASFNVNAELTKLLGLVVGYANTFYDYTGGSIGPGQPTYATLLNRVEHLFTVNSRWHVTEDTVGIFGYQFGAISYIKGGSIAPVGSPFVSSITRNDISHYIYVGAEHTFRSDLTGSVRAGAQITDYYNQDLLPPGVGSSPTSVGPFAELSLAYTYMDSGKLTVGFRQSKNQTDIGFDALTQSVTLDQESSAVYAQVDQTLTPLSPKLAAHLQAQYQVSKFNGGGFNNETDTFYLLGLNFTYQFTQFFSAEVGYNYDLLVSDIPNRGYDRNRVYIGVTATY